MLLLLLSFLIRVSGQTATATIDDHTASPGQVVVPVEVSNFNDIGAITMYFEYDENVVTYNTSQNPALDGLIVNAYAVDGVWRVGISWTASGATGSNIEGTLVEIVFNYTSDSCAFSFIENECEIVNSDFEPIYVEYDDGSISSLYSVDIELEDQLEQTPGDNISVPLNVDFSNIPTGAGSFTFIINYNEDVLDFQSISNEALSDIFVNELNNPKGVALIWTTSTSGSYLNGKLLDLNFTYLQGNTSMTFDTDECEISDDNAEPVSANYFDAVVTQAGGIASVELDSIYANAGSNVLLPLSTYNFQDVGAFDFIIDYLSAYLDYIELVNIHPNLDQTYLDAYTTNGTIGINWMMTPGNSLTIPDGEKMFDIKFYFTSSSSELVFDESLCDVSNSDLETISTEYTDGDIMELQPFDAMASIDSVTGTIGTDTDIPLRTYDFEDIAAIDFQISFDNSVIDFNQLDNVNEILTNNGTLEYNSEGNLLFISWTITPGATSGINIPDGEKLFDMDFYFSGGSCDVEFVERYCNVSDNDLNSVNVSYSDGYITGGATLTVNLFLSGIYNSDQGNMNKAKDYVDGNIVDKFSGTVADQISIELHNASDYNTIEYSLSEVNLNQDGSATVTIPGNYNDEYYITITNRNHIETVTALPVDFGQATISYDFTGSAGQAYESNQKELEAGVFGFYAGDVNQDGYVDINDSGPTITGVREGDVGYLPTDINGDGYVDINDSGPVITNVRLGIQKYNP